MSMDNLFLTETRVYVAGVLMPCLHVGVSASYNAPPTATLSLPADARLFGVGKMDRVPVHIFVRETMVDSPRFILLFEGFITESGYLNTASQREITVNATGLLDILNDVQLRFMTSLDDIALSQAPGEAEVARQIAAPGFAFPQILFMRGLNGGPDAAPIRFPSDYLANVYAFIQASGDSPDGTSAGCLNNSVLAGFYRRYAEGLRLLRRFERLPLFDEENPTDEDGAPLWPARDDPDKAGLFPMVAGMQTAEAVWRLGNEASEASPRQSAMELLQFLAGEMEYECAFFTSPAYHGPHAPKAEEKSETPKTGGRVKNPGPGAASTEAETEEEEPGILASTCLKPLFTEALPPLCNVLFKSQLTRVEMREAFKGVPTRVQIANTTGHVALLARERVASPVQRFGIIDYYPSSRFKDFLPEDEPYLRPLSSEWLEVEQYTGPWVAQVGMPRWINYVGVRDGMGTEHETAFKARYCHRQLLARRYGARQMSATGMFNPYVTPGFPGVVFDGGPAGFAFAGHVLAVEHQLSPGQASTSVSLNYARPLEEACAVPLPHPLKAMETICRSPEKMTRIYAALLGTPDVEVSGAAAVGFSEVWRRYHTEAGGAANPQNSPAEAYRVQRRNIVTFEDYCFFMGLEVETGPGPEGADTPLLLNGDFVENRRPWVGYDMSPLERVTEEDGENGEKEEAEESAPELVEKDVRDVLRLVAVEGFSRRAYKP